MISVSEALAKIKAHTRSLPPIEKPLQEALGQVLASDVFSLTSLPPFHQSAVDGFAFLYDDYLQGGPLMIDGEIAAGSIPEDNYQPFKAVRIFTGAPLPSWADTVVMQEKTTLINNELRISDDQLVKGVNVRTKGFEIGEHDLALSKGTVLSPAAIGFLAGVGITRVQIYPMPRVHIIVTGNELQAPGKPLQDGQIYESNSVMLLAALKQLGVEEILIQKVHDDAVTLRETISTALETSDLLILTGGVSVGKYDYVVEAVEANGVERLFHKVAQRPGKPLYAGHKKEKLVFGLPGNPASVMSCFYVYVTAALEALTSRKLIICQQRLLSSPITKKIALTQFLKAHCDDREVQPLAAQESFRLSSFAVANCLICLPAEKMDFVAGDPVETILLPYL